MSGVYIIQIGLKVRRGERTYQMERELENGLLVFQDQVNGLPWSLSKREFHSGIHDGKWAVITGEVVDRSRPVDAKANLIFTTESLPQAHQQKLKIRMTYIEEARRLSLTRGMKKELQKLIGHVAQKINDQKPPGTSTLMSWMGRYDKGGCTPNALVSGHVYRKKTSRVHQKLLNIARLRLKKHYCTSNRPSLQETLVVIQRDIKKEILNGTLSPEDGSISYTTLVRLKNEIDPYILDRARYGAAYARNQWRYSLSGPRPERALQRYEIDHTVLDMVVISDVNGMPLGRPTLTVVIDAYSGYVVGLFISFWGTGLACTFSALKHAMSPKPDYRAVIPRLEHQMLGEGIPDELVMDNGLEFHSPQLTTVAMQLGMDLQWCAVRQPWLKPFVERAMGTLLNYLPAAGRVRKALTNELPQKPDETCAITFSHLVQGLVQAFCDVHAFEINNRRLARPYDLFMESLELLPPPMMPMDMKDLEIVVSPSKNLTVGNEGIVSDYLRYNSPELQQLRRATGHTYKTTVKFHPENLDYVYVQDIKTKGWLYVPSCMPRYTNGLSLVQHKAIRQAGKNELARKAAEETLLKGKHALMDLWGSAATMGKRLKSNQLKALKGMTSTHALQPIDEPHSFDSSPVLLVSADEMNPAPADIPVFGGFTKLED